MAARLFLFARSRRIRLRTSSGKLEGRASLTPSFFLTANASLVRCPIRRRSSRLNAGTRDRARPHQTLA
jgi:hypothetical protein